MIYIVSVTHHASGKHENLFATTDTDLVDTLKNIESIHLIVKELPVVEWVVDGDNK